MYVATLRALRGRTRAQPLPCFIPPFLLFIGSPPRIDGAAAEQTARTYVLQQQSDAAVDATADPATIVVTVRLHVPPTILHSPGQPSIEISADGTAHPFVGQAAPSN